ncbi:MAG: hypothetical protein EOP06_26175, partial [Proteobacteria bacterium]
ALNTFSSEKRSRVLKDSPQYIELPARKIETLPLKEILGKHLPKEQKIDFMSVDVEGLDFEVLSSNDWTKYRPTFVLYEDHEAKISSHVRPEEGISILVTGRTGKLLADVGYEFFAKTVATWIFKLKE